MSSTVDIQGMSPDDQARLIKLLRDQQAWEKERQRTIVQNAAIRKVITPDVVEAYAAVHLTNTDTGTPIVAARHHKLWLEFLCDPSIERLLILSPYGSAKTTWAVSAYIGCYIGINPEHSVLIVCNGSQTAMERANGLRGGVMSREYKTTFPYIHPNMSMPFTQEQWTLMREGQPQPNRLNPTLSAYGIDGQIIGRRANIILMDDILTQANTATAHQRADVRRTVETTVLSRVKSGKGVQSRVIMIGTSWHVSDYYMEAMRSGGWVVVHTPMLSDTDEFYATITYPDSWKHRTIGVPVGKDSL